MNVADVIVMAAVGVLALLAVAILRTNRRNGEQSCGGRRCSGCGRGCGADRLSAGARGSGGPPFFPAGPAHDQQQRGQARRSACDGRDDVP